MDKPPYRIPTMEETRALPWNGLNVASTFSGAGGSCTGYEMAGCKVVWANEFEPNAAATYRDNHPDTFLETRSIRLVHGADVLEATGLSEIDILDGSPPCQSFSLAGKRQRGWGITAERSDGTLDRTDDLFFDYGRLLGELQPRAFVAENVSGLVKGTAKGLFKRIMAMLTDQGYTVRAQLLDAQWLGVPQARSRVIILGMRNDLQLVPTFPKPWPYRYSIRDACPWITATEGATGFDGHADREANGPMPAVVAGRPVQARVTIDPKGQFDVRHLPVDGPMGTVTTVNGHHITLEVDRREAEQDEAMLTTHYGGILGNNVPHSLDDPAPTVMTPARMKVSKRGPSRRDQGLAARRARVAETDAPAPTVLASPMGWSDIAVERRRLTIEEVKRLCSFPDDYLLRGSYTQQWARLGNSVPPLMMRAVAENLAAQLLAAR